MHFTYYAKRRLIGGKKIKNSSSPRKTELSKQWLYFFAWRPNWRSSNVRKRDASKEPTPSIFESKESAFKFFLRGRSVQSPTLPAKKRDVFPPRSCRYDPFAAVAEGLFFVRGSAAIQSGDPSQKRKKKSQRPRRQKKRGGERGKFPSFDRPSTSSACHHCTERETSNPIAGKRERAGESKGGRGEGLWTCGCSIAGEGGGIWLFFPLPLPSPFDRPPPLPIKPDHHRRRRHSVPVSHFAGILLLLRGLYLFLSPLSTLLFCPRSSSPSPLVQQIAPPQSLSPPSNRRIYMLSPTIYRALSGGRKGGKGPDNRFTLAHFPIS